MNELDEQNGNHNQGGIHKRNHQLELTHDLGSIETQLSHCKGVTMKKTTLEKIFEYASMPVHGTLSRKLRKDIHCQVNDGKIYDGATFFLGEEFVRITEEEGGQKINTYYDWENIVSVRTIANSTK